MGQKQKKRERKAVEKKARLDEGKASDRDLEEILAGLTTEETEMFLAALELTMRKRRVQLLGYLATLLCLLVGSAWAFWMYGNREPGEFMGWAFLIPPAAAGLSLWGFGKLSRSLKPSRDIKLPERAAAAADPDEGGGPDDGPASGGEEE